MEIRRARHILIAATICGAALLFIFIIARRTLLSDAPADPSKIEHQRSTITRSRLEKAEQSTAPIKAATQKELDQLKAISIDDHYRRWKEITNSNQNEDERVFRLRGLVSAMALSGYSEEAIIKTHETFGAGRIRNELIGAIFHRAADPDVASRNFKLLQFKDEKVSACEGIAASLSMNFSPSNFNPDDYNFLGDSLDVMVASLAEKYVHNSASADTNKLNKAFSDALGLPIPPEAKKRVIRNLSSEVPFQCWDYISAEGIEKYSAEASDIASHMTHSDPSLAIAKLTSSKEATLLLRKAFSDWMAKDAKQPLEWLETNASGLSVPQLDQIYGGIANYAIQYGEADTAKKWATLIADSETRTKLLNSIR